MTSDTSKPTPIDLRKLELRVTLTPTGEPGVFDPKHANFDLHFCNDQQLQEIIDENPVYSTRQLAQDELRGRTRRRFGEQALPIVQAFRARLASPRCGTELHVDKSELEILVLLAEQGLRDMGVR